MNRPECDLVIRGGLIVDGSGSQPILGDLAIHDGVIVEIGQVPFPGREEIDASGKVVTPGFIDIHTHFDGQATWSTRLSPSSEHGVTTVVIGNCGVGFAPCRPADREALVKLMEGVEDIPGAVMHEGLPWTWESFPDFLDFLATRQFDIDVAAYLPHAPLRVFAMGERGLAREPATARDLERMKQLVAEAIGAGAIGVSTSRSLNHRLSDHHLMPGISATEGELMALAEGIRDGGEGLFQFISDFEAPEADFAMLRRVSERSEVPLTFSLMQVPHAPERWRKILELTEQANDEGVKLQPQVFSRPIGSLLGLRQNYNVFSFSPAYAAIAHLPLGERLARLREPGIRQQIIAEYPTVTREPVSGLLSDLRHAYLMDDVPEYEPEPADSIAAMADRMGCPPVELAYDLLIEDEGRNVVYMPVINFSAGWSDALATMLNHRDTLIGLGDGGAHVGVICDASGQTYMLQRWVGDGSNGTMPIAQVVKSLSWDNARAVKLNDRGLLRLGYRADVNVIDLERLCLHRPEMVYDLPRGGGRFIQRADGYAATIVAGSVTYREGSPTGSLPGRLVRGPQSVQPATIA